MLETYVVYYRAGEEGGTVEGYCCLPEADDERQKRRFFRHVSELIAFDDCTDICVQKIVYRGKPVSYCGWQPGMLFEYKDEDGNLVYSGSFPEWDH